MTSTESIIETLLKILGSKAYDYIAENRCQEQMEQHFRELGIGFIREFRLDEHSRIDFYFPNSGLGLEVKAGKSWSRKKVYRQVERYTRSPEIRGVILATGRAQSLPALINDKPIRLHCLGAAHL
jgi:hypothetical protein